MQISFLPRSHSQPSVFGRGHARLAAGYQSGVTRTKFLQAMKDTCSPSIGRNTIGRESARCTCRCGCRCMHTIHMQTETGVHFKTTTRDSKDESTIQSAKMTWSIKRYAALWLHVQASQPRCALVAAPARAWLLARGHGWPSHSSRPLSEPQLAATEMEEVTSQGTY